MGILAGVAGLTAGAGAAISSGVGAAAGIGSSIATNRKNQQLAQMNNEFNERMLDKQINYNREAYQTQLGDTWKFWHAANQYNDPSQQVQRLRNAGLNPYLAINNPGMASVQSAPSQQGINPPTATPVQANYEGIGQAIRGAVDAYFSNRKTSQETSLLEIEKKTAYAKALATIDKLIADTKDKNSQRMLRDTLADLQKTSLQLDNEGKALTNQGIKTSNEMAAIDLIEKNERLKVLPQTIKNQLIKEAGEIALLKSQDKLNKESAEEIAQRIAESFMRQNQMAMDQAEQADTYKVRRNKMVAQLEKAILNSGLNDPTGLFNVVSQIFGASNIKQVRDQYDW